MSPRLIEEVLVAGIRTAASRVRIATRGRVGLDEAVLEIVRLLGDVEDGLAPPLSGDGFELSLDAVGIVWLEAGDVATPIARVRTPASALVERLLTT